MNTPTRHNRSSYRILPLAAFRDNYIWLLRADDPLAASVVDPGDAQPVLAYLAREKLRLAAILITHHHADHTGGIAELCATYPEARVYGSNEEGIARIDTAVTHGDRIERPGTIEATEATEVIETIDVIETPGHTRHHLAYYDRNHQGYGALFCGDTLFSAGCGRLFEGTPAQMQDSLARLRALPAATRIYCAHEYTELNLKFARAIEPDNPTIAAYARQVAQQRAAGQPSLPTTLQQERAINPFLRWDTPAIQQAAARFRGLPLQTFIENQDPVAVFAAIREWRNDF
ncbi:MAG: hydroxyacylglutathione hydrolase [Sterolibacterium sp.]|jgi:hydroxyacylglutathione hydrolase|nr:hydroxyacylglutathione hydrolase [Sterolibacterium sp.]